MADIFDSGEHASILDSSKAVVPGYVHDFIDLTDSDDTQIPSVSTHNFSNVSKEIMAVRTNFKRPHSLDESVSIIYENIKPAPELEIVELADDIVGELRKEGSLSCGGQISRKVRIGAKAVNVSVSIITKTIESPSIAKGETTNETSPEIIDETISVIPKPQESSIIECGICLDPADEITASERKLVATVCGHIFCCQCFDRSMKVSRLCPKCRKRLTKKQFHPIYL